MKGALTLVTRLKHPVLQEKFSSILEVKAKHHIFEHASFKASFIYANILTLLYSTDDFTISGKDGK
jgi:hypothetical protein